MLFTNIECAKITIFPNRSKQLIRKSAFFSFSFWRLRIFYFVEEIAIYIIRINIYFSVSTLAN